MKYQRCLVASCISASALLAVGCEDGPVLNNYPEPPADPGALISVTLDGKVGVLLDEIPEGMRAKVADGLQSKPESFWLARAKEQMRLTSLRLNFRQFYYDPADMKFQLPIPPEDVMRFDFADTGAVRTMVDGHDVVAIDYHFHSYVITTLDSPGISEPALAEIGGVWDQEDFVFPLDPTLLLERTGLACMSEVGYPPDSIDTENAYLFYFDRCEVEAPTAIICHVTQPSPQETCKEALKRTSGRVSTAFKFERVPWDDAIANEYRVGGIQQPDYTDMAVRSDFLNHNNIVYEYFPPDHCALEEKCVGAPGWRRLLKFDAVDENVGGKPMNIGSVDYYLAGGDPENQLHGMYEFSACHQHYHFKHYGEFSLEGVAADPIYKAGFCLQSTDRLSNHEGSPIYNPYADCAYQGVEVGWSDKYQAGLPCQWLDITDSEAKGPPVEATLSFHSNPDDFLCEGTPVLDAAGNQVWEKTKFTTADGKQVDRPACDFFTGAADNDIGSTTVDIPSKGGVMTSPCTKNQFGPYRNCDFSEKDDKGACTPGQMVQLKCTVADPSRAQVVRVCEHSFALDTGTACSAIDARATEVIDGTDVGVSFMCPEKRDDVEVGGRYTIYTAPLWNADGDVPVTCVPDL